jgi:signal transduction histidine kinase
MTIKTLPASKSSMRQVIQSSGNGLLGLIDEILDLSKIEAGKMELDYVTVSIKEICDDMKGLFAPIAREKGPRFRCQY